jgi:hypothetical protein
MESSVIKAILLASLTGFLNALLYIFAISDGDVEFKFVVLVGFMGITVVFVAIIVWGLPMHYLLRRLNKTGFGWYMLVGMVQSLLVPLDYLLGGYYLHLVMETVFFSYVGMIAAIVFRANMRGLYA